MRKPAIVALLIVLLAAAVVQAQTVKSHMMAGPYAGYSLGFGDAFQEEDNQFFKASFKPGLNFGAMFHYGLTDKLMLGGELHVQQYKFEYEDKVNDVFSLGSYDESSTETDIIGSMLYAMSYMQKAILMLNAGAGLYGGGSGSDIGLFGGIQYHYLIARTLTLVFMPRLHFILSDSTAMLLQLSVAVNWWLGATGTPID